DDEQAAADAEEAREESGGGADPEEGDDPRGSSHGVTLLPRARSTGTPPPAAQPCRIVWAGHATAEDPHRLRHLSAAGERCRALRRAPRRRTRAARPRGPRRRTLDRQGHRGGPPRARRRRDDHRAPLAQRPLAAARVGPLLLAA